MLKVGKQEIVQNIHEKQGKKFGNERKQFSIMTFNPTTTTTALTAGSIQPGSWGGGSSPGLDRQLDRQIKTDRKLDSQIDTEIEVSYVCF